jgi:hypothetical protein
MIITHTYERGVFSAMNCKRVYGERASVPEIRIQYANRERADEETGTSLNEQKRAEWFGAVLSLPYEFNWSMGETEILQRSMKSANLEDLRSLLADLKKAELISEPLHGNWKLTKKGKEMVRKSLG